MWAKIVNNEVMQLHEEDPKGLWHPDQIAKNDLPGYWEEVPDQVHIGWRFRNDEWISGGQWHEEWVSANPTPPPGPPHGSIQWSDSLSTFEEKKFVFTALAGGIIDEYNWIIDGKSYTGQEVSVTIVCGDASKDMSAELTVTGPGGSHTSTQEFVIPALFVPPRAGTMEKDR